MATVKATRKTAKNGGAKAAANNRNPAKSKGPTAIAKSTRSSKAASRRKWVYSFGDGAADGSAAMRELLGGKGANLAEMSRLGLPVPPGFTITTEVCTWFYDKGRSYPPGLAAGVVAALARVQRIVGAKFGDAKNPLLVSVRSGAPASMPGMMDTVLNLGLNDETVRGLADLADDERFAYDSYRRFIQMYSDVVLGVPHENFEEIIETAKDERGFTLDTELSAADWREVIKRYQDMVKAETHHPFPQDVLAQLWGAIGAVFGSWMNDRAVSYRMLNRIPEHWGTAVTVQAMVFGNMGETSATGVAFTRNPATGERRLFGEYLVNAQGEDVVAGIRTPQHLTRAGKEASGDPQPAMEELMPGAFAELTRIQKRLEHHYRDMQDIEFTIQKGKLWMLQTRTAKRTARAAIRIAVDMVAERMIDPREAIMRIDPASLDQLLHPTPDPKAPREIIARGLAASPGAVSGKVVFHPDQAVALAQHGEAAILVRVETSPEDIRGMHAARGILTARGGTTSHAAVVARGMGRPCVSGASQLRIDYAGDRMTAGHHTVQAGDIITIDGSTGEVILGTVPTVEPELSGDFARLMRWADQARKLQVWANAETPRDAETARDFGAEGIGLSRTEHMFFEADRIDAVREMILATDRNTREVALAKLLPMQRQDFVALFRIMESRPVTIRLLDPPLHEFLPKTEEDLLAVARVTGVSTDALRARAAELEEVNPMLGHRGCRLGISFPEIYMMQARAIFEAAVAVGREIKRTVVPEIMLPLIATKAEFDILAERIHTVAAEVKAEVKAPVRYRLGTMIELPRAALMAGEIAEGAEFFSFGTNDLTQTAFGLSRDDSASFLETYMRQGLLQQDPFITLDRSGVGELVRIATARGRATRPDIKLGICGEHGGDPASIVFCHEVGLNYVSCSPYRVPIARLAAAQAAVGEAGTATRKAASRKAGRLKAKPVRKMARSRSAAKRTARTAVKKPVRMARAAKTKSALKKKRRLDGTGRP